MTTVRRLTPAEIEARCEALIATDKRNRDALWNKAEDLRIEQMLADQGVAPSLTWEEIAEGLGEWEADDDLEPIVPPTTVTATTLRHQVLSARGKFLIAVAYALVIAAGLIGGWIIAAIVMLHL